MIFTCRQAEKNEKNFDDFYLSASRKKMKKV